MKRKPFGERLIASMGEGLDALKQGDEMPTTFHPSLPAAPELSSGKILKIRKCFGVTQEEFSRWLVVSPKTVQSWEQGTRVPSGTVRRVLQILSSPEMVKPFLQFQARMQPVTKRKKKKTLA